MSNSKKYEPPEPGLGDVLYTSLQSYLSVVSVTPILEIATIATAANALLTGLFPSPLEKRDREWMKAIAEGLRHLEENQSIDPRKLLSDELFITILIQASQKAIQNHQIEKINALRNAVFNSALGVNIRDDLQLVFIRYLGELTPSHIILLEFFQDKEQLAQVNSYEQLFEEFSTENAQNIGRDEFKLLCEDLTGRYLLRISSQVDDFGGIYEPNNLLLESSKSEGPMLMVTDIGKKLLKYIAEPELLGLGRKSS